MNFSQQFILLCVASVFSVSVSAMEHPIFSRFQKWVDAFKIEVRDDSHLAHLFDNWVSNDKYIETINSANLSYSLGHNQFSGMNQEEFSAYMGFKENAEDIQSGAFLRGSTVPETEYEFELDLTGLPASVDWRTKNVVGAIRDQAQCGSCWAFSGTSTVESAVAIKTGTLYDLSEQESVSCTTLKNGYTNLGCNGGNYNVLWNYAKDNGGLCTEDSYPYTSGTGNTGTCLTTCKPVSAAKVASYVKVTPYSDSALMTALTIGPVSIALEADTRSFQLYNSGIYSDYTGCGGANPQLDHAVVLVGYGSSNGVDYYIMRNSWGTTWGDQTDGNVNKGYMMMARGSAYGKAGLCGLLSTPMYPVV
jgi:C1A family cysteine protease